VHEVHDLLEAIAAGRPAAPTFADGLQVDRVLAAIGESASAGRWVDVERRS
jgi:predicted dehydrogenase